MGRGLAVLALVFVTALAPAAAWPADQRRAGPVKRAPAAKARPAPKSVVPTTPILPPNTLADLALTKEEGRASAIKVTSRCLEGPQPEACAHLAFLQCKMALGAQAEQELNDCAAYARAAWDERLEAATSRLLQVMQQTGRAKPAPRALVASNKKWQGWSASDCETQTEATRGAALHALDVNLCLSGHATARVVELQQLAALWGG
jgi:uncharacterized protein YecT (DUF1311 family)